MMSFSIFLWNEPVTRFMAHHGLTAPGRRGLLLNVGVIGTVIALLSCAAPASPAAENAAGPAAVRAP